MVVKASQLRLGQLVTVAGMKMVFFGFVDGSPYFLHDGQNHISYHNRDLDEDSLIEVV